MYVIRTSLIKRDFRDCKPHELFTHVKLNTTVRNLNHKKLDKHYPRNIYSLCINIDIKIIHCKLHSTSGLEIGKVKIFKDFT